MPEQNSRYSRTHLTLGVIGTVAAVISTVIAVMAFNSGGVGAGAKEGGATVAAPTPPTPDTFSASPSDLPPPATVKQTTASSAESVTYLDDYVHQCNVNGSIQDTHDASIRGSVHTHAVNQTPNGYEGTAFLLGGRAGRFQANIGVRDASGPGHRIRFRLLGDGRELYDSGLIGSGEAAHSVDVAVDGVGTLIIAAYGDTGIGNATWGEARVTGQGRLSCPQ